MENEGLKIFGVKTQAVPLQWDKPGTANIVIG
jgi:hypothetical protein